MNFAYVNGAFLPEGAALIPIQDRGFRFGDGAFETIALHAGRPYQFQWHMARLARGLEALRIPYDTGTIHAPARELLSKNKAQTGFLRIQITRGRGSAGSGNGGASCKGRVTRASPAPAQPENCFNPRPPCGGRQSASQAIFSHA